MIKQFMLMMVGCVALLAGCASAPSPPLVESTTSSHSGRIYPPEEPVIEMLQRPGRIPYQSLVLIDVASGVLEVYGWNGVNWEANVTMRTIGSSITRLPQEVMVGEVVRIGPAHNPVLNVVSQVEGWRRWRVVGVESPITGLSDQRSIYLSRRHLQILFNRLRGFRPGVQPGEVVIVLHTRSRRQQIS